MLLRRRTRTGWFFTVTGFLACPCHLVVTLPLAVALFGGTALGGWIATHEGAIALGATLYFVGALAVGATLLLAQTSRQAVEMDGTDAAATDAAASNGAAQDNRCGMLPARPGLWHAGRGSNRRNEPKRKGLDRVESARD